MRTFVEFCLMTVIGFGAAGNAQTPPPAPDAPVPTLKVSTRLTIEYVAATDSQGKPVRGLTQVDFIVKEDGKPQVIKNFEEHGTAKTANEASAASQSPNGNAASSQPNATVGAPTILLFDQVTTGVGLGMKPPDQLDYAKKQSDVFVKTMPTGTEVAVIDLGDAVRIVQGFTSDRERLLTAIDSIKYQLVSRTFVNPPVPRVMACEAANKQSQLVLDTFGGIASVLSGKKERTNLIWFTPGIPWLTDFRLFNLVSCLNDYTEQTHRAYGLLASAQVVLYPIDPRGVILSSTSGADYSGVAPSPQTLATSYGLGGSSLFDEYNSLKYFAKATGGIAYMGRNDLAAAIGEVVASGDDYYSLAYVTPPSKYEKYHSIKVTVDRPGLRLRYREGYTSVDEKAGKTH